MWFWLKIVLKLCKWKPWLIFFGDSHNFFPVFPSIILLRLLTTKTILSYLFFSSGEQEFTYRCFEQTDIRSGKFVKDENCLNIKVPVTRKRVCNQQACPARYLLNQGNLPKRINTQTQYDIVFRNIVT